MDLIKEGFDKQHIEETLKRCNEIIDTIIKSNEILGLGNSEIYTIQSVYEYYNDTLHGTVDECIRLHKDELLANGMQIVTGKELKAMLVTQNFCVTNKRGSFECEGQTFANKSNRIFNKRAILNIGMLLTESKVAERVRSDILDILFRSDNNGTTAEKIADNVKEKELNKLIAKAYIEGDYTKAAIYQGELNALIDKDRKNQNQTCEYDIRDAMQKRCRAVFNLHTPEYNELYKKAKQVTCNRFNVTTWKDLKNYATTHDVIPYIENELDLNVIICELGLEKMKKGKQKRLF